eukprot:7376065-Prymnesium_polylepis.1
MALPCADVPTAMLPSITVCGMNVTLELNRDSPPPKACLPDTTRQRVMTERSKSSVESTRWRPPPRASTSDAALSAPWAVQSDTVDTLSTMVL